MASRVRSKGKIRRKNFRIDVAMLERVRKVLKARTETETIHKALDYVLKEEGYGRALRNLIVKGHGEIRDIRGDR